MTLSCRMFGWTAWSSSRMESRVAGEGVKAQTQAAEGCCVHIILSCGSRQRQPAGSGQWGRKRNQVLELWDCAAAQEWKGWYDHQAYAFSDSLLSFSLPWIPPSLTRTHPVPFHTASTHYSMADPEHQPACHHLARRGGRGSGFPHQHNCPPRFVTVVAAQLPKSLNEFHLKNSLESKETGLWTICETTLRELCRNRGQGTGAKDQNQAKVFGRVNSADHRTETLR